MTIFAVSTHDELMTAISSAAGGDEIVLATGDYGDLSIRSESFASDVTIRSANPDDPAVFDTVTIALSNNIVFENIIVDMPVDATTIEPDHAIRITSSDGIAFKNSSLIGGDAVNGIDPSEPAGSQGLEGINGYPIGRAVYIVDSTNAEFSDLMITGFNKGIILDDTDGVLIANNEFFNIRSDAITGSGIDNVLIEGNHVENISAWRMGGEGDHPDFIHFFIGADQLDSSDNITIRANFFEQGDGAAPLGLHFESLNASVMFTNVILEDNVIQNGESQGIRFGNVDGGVIRNNTLVPTDESSSDAPGIILTQDTQNVVIQDNILSKIYGDLVAEAGVRNITLGDNLYVQAVNPILDNYVGDLFLNGLDTDAGVLGLRLVPGLSLEGYGAQLSVFDTTPASLDGYIADARGTGLNMDTHAFSVEMFLGSAGAINTSDATVHWNFGDGTTATGPDATHTFDTAGLTTITATATVDGQAPILFEKQIFVLTPNALDIDFDSGAQDDSLIENPVTLAGGARIVDSYFGKALSLESGSAIARVAQNIEIVDNPEFSYSVSVKKDAAAIDDTGYVTYFSGTAVIKVAGDTVSVAGRTDLDEAISLRADGLDLSNTDWHTYSYVFSQPDGTASLFVDGQKVDEMTGLEGGQYTSTGHDLTIGSPFGNSLAGEYDNVRFVRGALSDQQIAENHDAFLAGEIPVILEPDTAEDPIIFQPIEPVLTQEPIVVNGTLAPTSEPMAVDAPQTPTPTFDGTDTGGGAISEEKDVEAEADSLDASSGGGTSAGDFFGFITKFFQAIMSIFTGGSKGSAAGFQKPVETPYGEMTDAISLEDVVPVTQTIPETNDGVLQSRFADEEDDDLNAALATL